MSVVRPIKEPQSRQPAGLPSRELQELWFATRRKDWKSLVVVPAAPGLSAFPIAKALGEIGSIIRMSPVQVVNAEGLDLPSIAMLVNDFASEPRHSGSVWTSGAPGNNGPQGSEPFSASRQERAFIVAIEPVVTNPLALPLALAADAVLICLELGVTELSAAQHTIDLVGRERLVGSVLLSPR
jgi:hypothetical protein